MHKVLVYTSTIEQKNGSRGGRASTRLAFQVEDPGSIPGAGSHVSFIFSLYISIVFITVHRIGTYHVGPMYRSCILGT